MTVEGQTPKSTISVYCVVRPGGRLGFALLVLFVRALLILAHEVIADVMMTVIDYRP